ncbi:MAG: hypothetical protein Q8N83_02760 [Ignavibacteria bacterium]|nr:hypothetical protein [Ignavibacteria bacterium]
MIGFDSVMRHSTTQTMIGNFCSGSARIGITNNGEIVNYKKRNKKVFLFLLIFPVMLFIINGCSSAPQMQSDWHEKVSSIDGKNSGWETKVYPVPAEKINVGFTNDDDFLYVRLTTDDRSTIRQILKAGFIVWIEPASGNTKQFGIKYPLPGLPPDQLDRTALDPDGLKREPRGEQPSMANMEQRMLEQLQKQVEFQIIDKNKKPITAIPIINREGINLEIRMEKGILIYELQVPLIASDMYSFAVGAKPGEKVKIKFETEAPMFGNMKRPQEGMSADGQQLGGDGDMPSNGEGRGEGRHSGGGRSGGSMPPGGGPGGMKKVETLDYSVELTLSKKNANQ